MANVFKNPLVVAETVVGSLIDQRAVVLYEQKDFVDTRSEIEKQLQERASGTIFEATINDFVTKNNLEELFTGIEVKYLSDINGYNAWGVSYMSADVDISSDLCDHPIETGAKITDSAIRNPISAKVNIVMPTAFYEKIYTQIYDFYENKKKIILLTKFGVYKNMVIQSMPYKLEHGTVDRATIELQLREIMEVLPEYEFMSGSEITPKITPDRALSSDDTDMQVIGQKRYITTLVDSLGS